jgi:hypothetical protein
VFEFAQDRLAVADQTDSGQKEDNADDQFRAVPAGAVLMQEPNPAKKSQQDRSNNENDMK